MMGRFVALLAVSLTFFALLPVAGAPLVRSDRDSAEILAAGNPALTVGMATRFADFFEWILEAPLTLEQREKMRGLVVGAWKEHSQSDIDGVVEILKTEAQVAPLPAEQRTLVLAQVQPEFLKALQADTNDEFNRWLLDIYNTAHAAIAPGNPPLTRQASDAVAEMFAFMLTEAAGQQVAADQQFKDDFAKRMKQLYPQMPAAKQAEWAQSPVIWASLRVIWAQTDAKGRTALRKQWSDTLGGAVPEVKDRAALDAALNDLSRLTDLRKQRDLKTTELEQAAKDCNQAAGILRKDAGDAGAGQAAQLEQTAAALRRQSADLATSASPAAAPPAGAHGQETVAQMMARDRANHQMFMSMMNMSMQSYYSSINVINTLGDSPYRYVNAYGH